MAELVGGAFLSSFFQFLFDQVASPLLSKIFKSPTHDEGEKLLKELESKFRRLSVVLNDAEKKQITNPVVKEWMDELKDVFYQADDLLDEIATKELGCKVEDEYRSAINQVRASNSTYPSKKQKASTSTSDSSSFNAELVSKMKEIVGSLEKFLKEKDDLGLKEDVGLTQKWSHSRRLPSTSLVDESGVYGRDNNKEEIIKILLSGEASGNKIDVIPIVGMGGVGKTTLAQLVYNDGRVVEHFDMKVWVCVSDEFDVLRVTRTILEAITSSNYDKKDLNLLQVELKERLLGKKFLIVLDDVWNENRTHWENLWTPFTAGASGSKIIATTRIDSVASIMRTVPVHHLQQLSDEDCWSLFAKIAFDKGDSKAFPKLEEKGKQIVKKCKGLPLAAKTLGGLLCFKLDVEDWDEILKSDIWDLPEDKNNILPVLRLSYHYLPSHLKQCFAYCSTFPKDYEFKKEKLVLFWIAQNFVQQPRKNKTLEKIGEEYFHELLSRSFFQKSSGNESFFVMHDLVHDLAQVVHGQFSFRVDDNKQLDISPKARHFSYVREHLDGFEKLKAINKAKCLRSFFPIEFQYQFSDGYLAKKVLDDIFQTQRCLRLLSLPRYNIMELHDSIGNLIHLRYLDLSRTRIKQLPERVCTLYNLQTLLLSKCVLLTTLPVDIGKLIFLRHLDISGTKLREMPIQMSRLKGLQHLTDFVVGNCSGLVINELKEFHLLCGALTISSLQNVKTGTDAFEAKLKEKKHLEELVLEWGSTTDNSKNEREVLDSLQPCTNLKCLTINRYGGTRFPKWLGDHSYSNIVSLCLDGCDHCILLPPLGQLSSLKCLNIARMNAITTVGEEFYGDGSSTKPFQSLETLCFREMLEWLEWHICGSEVFSQLKELRVIKCPKLVGGLPNHIPSLVILEIRQCSALTASLPRTSAADELVLNGCNGVELEWQGVTSLVKLEISNMPSLKELTPELYMLTNLQNLIIKNCPSLLSFPDTGLPPMITSLKVVRCEALDSINVCLNTCLQDLSIEDCSSLLSITDGVLPLTLTSIYISACWKLVFPLSEEMECCYSSLEKLNLFGCGTLESLPLRFFLKLQLLDISCCPKLVFSLSEEMECCYSSLEKLKLFGCNTLKSLPLRFFPKLQLLNITSCPKLVLLLSEEMECCYSSLENLILRGCSPLKSLPLRFFPKLQVLDITDCEILSISNGRGLENLYSFAVNNCKNLKSLPERMNSHFPSLQSMTLRDCPEIESFPEGDLPSNLHSLAIAYCKKLVACRREWGLQSLSSLKSFSFIGDYEEEDVLKSFLEEGLLPSTLTSLLIQRQRNLKSLNYKGFQLPSSLKQLSIHNCPQLESLPEEGLLASLSKLYISRCPLLEPRCKRDRGDEWHKIAHIPFIKIDDDVIF